LVRSWVCFLKVTSSSLINFKVHGISQGVHKLVRTPMLVIKKIIASIDSPFLQYRRLYKRKTSSIKHLEYSHSPESINYQGWLHIKTDPKITNNTINPMQEPLNSLTHVSSHLIFSLPYSTFSNTKHNLENSNKIIKKKKKLKPRYKGGFSTSCTPSSFPWRRVPGQKEKETERNGSIY